jgi:hypothetical protein
MDAVKHTFTLTAHLLSFDFTGPILFINIKKCDFKPTLRDKVS